MKADPVKVKEENVAVISNDKQMNLKKENKKHLQIKTKRMKNLENVNIH